MGRKSSIDALPEKLRKRLLELLQKPWATQKDVTDIINDEAGDKVVSKSAVNRYALKMHKFAERNRQAREVADRYIAEYGEERQGKIGKVINEQLRMVTFDLLMNLNDLKDSEQDPKNLSNLAFIINKVARAIKDLEQAANANLDREQKIKEQVEETAEEVAKTAKSAGLSEETVEAIKKRILGIG